MMGTVSDKETTWAVERTASRNGQLHAGSIEELCGRYAL